MKLILSRDCPRNTSITNATGDLLYTVKTPFAWRRTTTIQRTPIQSTEKSKDGGSPLSDKKYRDSDAGHQKAQQCVDFAQIEWVRFGSSTLKYATGEEVAVNEYLVKSGPLSCGFSPHQMGESIDGNSGSERARSTRLMK